MEAENRHWRHPEGPRFLVDPRLQPGAAQPRAEGSRVEHTQIAAGSRMVRARSLTRLNCAGFRDDAFDEGAR